MFTREAQCSFFYQAGPWGPLGHGWSGPIGVRAFNLLRAARAPGQPYVPVDNTAHPDGLLCSAIVCARFGRAGLPRERGGIFDAAFGVVFPLAGGRCVPRTGVRLDCPLGVASPASLPCLSLLPTLVRLEIPFLEETFQGETKNVISFFLELGKSYVHELLLGSPPNTTMTCI